MDRSQADLYETIGMLVIEWGRLEERFPQEQAKADEPKIDLAAASSSSGVSEAHLHRVRRLRNAVVHRPSNQATLAEIDEALGVLELVWSRLDGAPSGAAPATEVPRELPKTTAVAGAAPPSRYPNPRADNPWDNDAVHWLISKPDVAAAFKRGPLFECLRCQPGRVRDQPHRVEEAARLARRHGVVQRQELDVRLGKRVVRLYRTDPGRPAYPSAPLIQDR